MSYFPDRMWQLVARAALIVLLVGTAFGDPSRSQAGDFPPLEIMTEDWAPYQFKQDGALVGITVDLVVEILKDVGSLQTRSDIQLLPWARGYHNLQIDSNGVLFLTTKTIEREALFKWVGPIFQNSTYLIAKKSREIIIDDSALINDYYIGAIIGDIGLDYLRGLGVDDKNINQNTLTKYNQLMLSKDRVDMVIDNWVSFLSDAQINGIDPNLYEKVYLVDVRNVSIAFNADVPDHVVATMQASLDKLRARGFIDELFTLYGQPVSQ